MTNRFMEEITLQALLEAGCHFGHKAERWHPKAADFIYVEKDGIHIIDLVKTKVGLEKAAAFVRELVAGGGEVLFVGTKRQARGVVKEEAQKAGAPFFVERWIGGFLTNWESVKKNIEKIKALSQDQESGAWKKFPKHEQSKLARYLAKLKVFYGGVLALAAPPLAIYIVDIKKEVAAMREAQRTGVPIVAIVDTNANPLGIDYVIPANDDAVGSIQYITRVMAQAYKEGKQAQEKPEIKAKKVVKEGPEDTTASVEPVAKATAKKMEKVEEKEPKEVKKKRGRPKKVKSDQSTK